MKPLRILSVSALFPPDLIGGAEASAARLAEYWASRGHQPGVLTTAKSASDEINDVMVNGIRTWRIFMPRIYPTFRFSEAPAWQKPIWHLQDHFHPHNRKIMGRVLDEFQPDFVNVHMIQGVGYNALREIARRDIPTVYILHDLGLACIRQSMFKHNADCQWQCGLCRLSSRYKRSLIERFIRIGFLSPSRANLERLSQLFPIKVRRNAVILDPNRYPRPTVARVDATTSPRLLFIGRLHDSKGISLLLRVLEKLAPKFRFSMTVIGTGPLEASLREQYSSASWCSFAGFIDQVDISNYIINSDLLCVPSIWQENSPGVVIHALSLALPVMASNKGGIPELVRDSVTGILVGAGDENSWSDSLRKVLESPGLLHDWRNNAEADVQMFDQEILANKFLDFMRSVAAGQ